MEEPIWSDWKPLLNSDYAIPCDSGIYEIRWAIGGKPQTVPRFNGKDINGLLYIGKTTNLQKRIGFIRHSLNGEMTSPHTAIYTYKYFVFERKIKPEQLEVRWTESKEIEYLEAKLLFDYIMEYLDKPPLNISVPKRM